MSFATTIYDTIEEVDLRTIPHSVGFDAGEGMQLSAQNIALLQNAFTYRIDGRKHAHVLARL